MKPILVSVLLCCAVAGLSSLDLAVGVVASGLDKVGAEAVVQGPEKWLGHDLRPEFGVEARFAGSTAQVLVPCGLSWESYLEEGWSWGLSARALVGASLVASPVYLWGAEGSFRVEFAWVPGLALGISAGTRYLAETVEFPLRLFLEIPLGPEDPLEAYDNQDHGEDEGTK
jgi:hypothetical protein